jgi:hypothetical protein
MTPEKWFNMTGISSNLLTTPTAAFRFYCAVRSGLAHAYEQKNRHAYQQIEANR